MTTAQQRGRRTLLLIAACFFLPIAVAAYMYYSGSSWRPADSTQFGDLITPPRVLPDVPLGNDAAQSLHGSWSLLVLADTNCSAVCDEALDHVKRVRLSLGPKMSRVQAIYLPATATAIAQNIESAHPGLVVLAPDQSAELRAIVGQYSDGQVFLVDPLGNLMMEYAAGTEMSAIRKDLTHLLNLSGIG